MKCYSYTPPTVLLAAMLCASISVAAEVPPQTFSIDKITVGIATLTDAKKFYGTADAVRADQGDESDLRICYAYSSSKGKSYLSFESGPMGGFKKITGFRISIARPTGNCVPTKTDISILKTRNGVRLGQSIDDFKKIIPVKFKRRGSELTYEGNDRREMTMEELKKLRAELPDAKQDYFDVTIDLIAKFKNNRLIDFYIQKIESY